MSLELEKISLKIDSNKIVDDISILFQLGNFITIVGPNGSGKTTLLRLAAGLIAPTSGKILLNGQTLTKFSRREIAQQISFTPQNPKCNFAFTVREVIAMGRNPYLGRFNSETNQDRQYIQNAMNRTDVTHLSNKFVTELSAGELQRVWIARCLATETKILLLDEPIANLDIAHALDILELSKSLAREGKIVCIVLHDLNLARRFSDQIVLLNDGKIISQGLPGQVLSVENIKKVFQVNVQVATEASSEVQYVFSQSL